MSSVGSCKAGFWIARDAGTSSGGVVEVVAVSLLRARFRDTMRVMVAGLRDGGEY
jgi:hypothetical protein